MRLERDRDREIETDAEISHTEMEAAHLTYMGVSWRDILRL